MRDTQGHLALMRANGRQQTEGGANQLHPLSKKVKKKGGGENLPNTKTKIVIFKRSYTSIPNIQGRWFPNFLSRRDRFRIS